MVPSSGVLCNQTSLSVLSGTGPRPRTTGALYTSNSGSDGIRLTDFNSSFASIQPLSSMRFTCQLQAADSYRFSTKAYEAGATLRSYTSLPGASNYVTTQTLEKGGEVDSLLPTLVTVCSTQFSLASTGIASRVVIGDRIICLLNVTLPHGTNDLQTIASWTNPALSVVSASFFSAPSTFTSSLQQTVTTTAPSQIWYYGSALYPQSRTVPDSPISARLVLSIADLPALVTGSTIDLSSSVNISGLVNAATANSPTLTVAEPILTISTFTATPIANEAGSLVNYTVTVRHASTSTATAYDVVLTINTTSVYVSLLSGNTSTTAGVISITPAGVITVTVSSLAQGASFSTSFRVVVTNNVFPAQTVLVPGSIIWRSLPITTPTGVWRTYPYPAGTGNTATSNVTSNGAFVVIDPFSASNLYSSSLPTTIDPMVAVGERVTFTISALMVHATSTVSLRCQLPQRVGKLGALSSRITQIGAFVTASNGFVGQTGVATDTNADGVFDLVTFNLGTVVDSPHTGRNTANDGVTVEGMCFVSVY